MEIGKWLRGLGLAEYEAAFRKHEIDSEVLPKLTAEDLKELGVDSVGSRRKLLAAIAELSGHPASRAAASAPAPRSEAQGAERRHLTVLVCDLVGSTALAARLDPEDMREVLVAFNRCCADAIESHGGFVAKYLGDGALAYFGYPEAHEHDPELAVEAGLAIVRGVSKLATAAQEALRVRVGIATGLVVVGDIICSGAAEERGVVGETPNLAARLQAVADPDSVVISGDTRRLLGSLFDLKDLGICELKGIFTRAWMVVARSAVESRFEALHGAKLTAFVGREREIGLLLRLWGRAKAGAGQVALVHGEAGLGKSRLAAEFLKQIAAEPQARLRYYCSPQHRNTALYPVIVQMQRAAGFGLDDPPKVKLDKLDAMLATTKTPREDAALFADLLALENDGRYPLVDIAQPERRQRAMQALVGQIESLAQTAPVVMVLEDAHWADPTTLEMLSRVVDRIATLPVLHLVVYRPEIAPPVLGKAHVTEIAITRLAPSDIGAMIDDVALGQHLPTAARDEIIRRADGVPLFAEEIAKAVVEAEHDAGATAAGAKPPKIAVPASLQASLTARLDRLGPAKEAAQIAAAIGGESPFALLASVADAPADELEGALARLVEAGLMSRRGTPPDAAYLFKHALLQDLAYGALLREKKQTLHKRIAEVLEAQFPEVGETQPEALARHCALAGLSEKAAALWGKAGRRSLRRSALAEAESHFSQALDQIATHLSTPRLRREEIAAQIGLASTLQLRRGFASSETKAALACTLELIDRAAALGEPVQDSLALFTTLHGLWLASVVASAGEATQKLAAQCMALAQQAGAKGELIAAHRAVGFSRLFAGDFMASCASLDTAIGLFAPAENHALTRYGGDHWSAALSGRAAALWALGYPDAAQADAALSLTSAREFGHALTIGNNLIFAAWIYFGCGRYAVAGEHADELVALADAKGEPFYRAFGLMMQGLVLTATGDAETATKLLSSTLSAYRATGAALLTPHLLSHLAQAYAQLSRWDEARGRLDEALNAIEATGERWCESDIARIAGEIALAAPDKDEAKAEGDFGRALALARRQSAKSWELRAAASMARLWAQQGKPAEARELLAPVYGWFTQGFATRDLSQAKATLEELAD